MVLATGFIHMLPGAMEALSDECLPGAWQDYEGYGGLFAMLSALAMQLTEFVAHQYSNNITTAKADLETAPNHTLETLERPQATSEISEGGVHVGHQHGMIFQDDAKRHKISTYLLEFGIALHSVLIGVALGTNTDEFVALFIALGFHQFFEGMALGAQIAGVKGMSTRSAISMVLLFGVTTPVGIAVGIGIHSREYNPRSVTALLVNGILDSVSAGILIYVALVNLINAEMGTGAKGFLTLKKHMQLLYFFSLYLGVAAMAIVGRWS